jgi:hypothetical protein
MLTVDDQPVDLDRDPRPAVGRAVVQTRPEDPTGPRTVGILCIAGAVHYGLDGVELHTAADAPEARPFDAAFDHPIGGWAPRRLRHLVSARAALRGERPDSRRRAAIALAALHRDGFPTAHAVYIAFPDAGMRILGEEAGAREFARGGVEVWAVNAARDGADGTWRPILETRAARRYGIPYGQT